MSWSMRAPCQGCLSLFLTQGLCQVCLLLVTIPTSRQVTLTLQLAPICPFSLQTWPWFNHNSNRDEHSRKTPPVRVNMYFWKSFKFSVSEITFVETPHFCKQKLWSVKWLTSRNSLSCPRNWAAQMHSAQHIAPCSFSYPTKNWFGERTGWRYRVASKTNFGGLL